MTTALTLASAGPIVSIKEGRAFANSRDVAEFFGKRHADVLRSVDELVSTEPEAERNFAPSTWKDTNGRLNRCFDMDQEGFTLLAMGFTGPKALQFKRLYIRAFNAAMEEIQALRQAQAPAIPQSLPEALRLAAEQIERAQAAEQKVVELTPLAAVGARVVSHEHSLPRFVRTLPGVNTMKKRPARI